MAKLFDQINLAADIEPAQLGTLRAVFRPTNMVVTIVPNQSEGAAWGRGRMLSWGLPAPWIEPGQPAKPLINARSESLTQKQTFAPLVNYRCLIPASAYFEWRHIGKSRLKNRIYVNGAPVFAFAALASGPFTDDAGPTNVQSTTIITRAAQREIAHIHDRMPVILPPEAYRAWLDPTVDFDTVRPWLARPTSERMLADEDRPTQPDLFA